MYVFLRLAQVGDELLEINGNSTEAMQHSDAITIIKHGGDLVKLIVRRIPDEGNHGMCIYMYVLAWIS